LTVDELYKTFVQSVARIYKVILYDSNIIELCKFLTTFFSERKKADWNQYSKMLMQSGY